MKNIKGNLKHLGYDQEEAYFYKQNQELIEKLRDKKKAKEGHFATKTGRKLEVIDGGLSDNSSQSSKSSVGGISPSHSQSAVFAPVKLDKKRERDEPRQSANNNGESHKGSRRKKAA